MKMNRYFWAGFLAIAVSATPALAQNATFKEKSGDWSVYTYNAGGKKVCFTAAQPRSKKPKNVKRDPIYFYVSNWPKDKVSGEISIKMGYPLKPGVAAEIKIAAKSFKLFTKGEGAYIEKPPRGRTVHPAHTPARRRRAAPGTGEFRVPIWVPAQRRASETPAIPASVRSGTACFRRNSGACRTC